MSRGRKCDTLTETIASMKVGERLTIKGLYASIANARARMSRCNHLHFPKHWISTLANDDTLIIKRDI